MTYRTIIVLGTLLNLLLEGRHEIELDELVQKSHVPAPIVRNIVHRLSGVGLTALRDSRVIFLETDVVNFLLKIVESGLCRDLELLSKFVNWRVFEELVCEIFKKLGYYTIRRLRIPVLGKREEIDIVAIRNRLILLVEVKHYRRSKLKLEDVVRKHLERAKACVAARSEFLKRLPVKCFYDCYCVPVVVTLRDYGIRILENVPTVPVHTLRDFLENLPFELNNVRHFVL